MGLTVYVAVVSLAMKGCAGRMPDATLYAVCVPSALALGLLAFWGGRGIRAAILAPAGRHPVGICRRCGRGSLRLLTRERPGLAPAWVGSRCVQCGTTYRRAAGGVEVTSPTPYPGPCLDPRIRFVDEAGGAGEVVFLDEPPA